MPPLVIILYTVSGIAALSACLAVYFGFKKKKKLLVLAIIITVFTSVPSLILWIQYIKVMNDWAEMILARDEGENLNQDKTPDNADEKPREIVIPVAEKDTKYPIKTELVDEEQLEYTLTRAKGFDFYQFYSWKEGSKWRFSIFKGVTRERLFIEISSEKVTITSLSDLDRAFAMIPAKTDLHWNNREFVRNSQKLITPKGKEIFFKILKLGEKYGHTLNVYPDE